VYVAGAGGQHIVPYIVILIGGCEIARTYS